MKTDAPETIYLEPPRDLHAEEYVEWMWTEAPDTDHAVKYVRADTIAALRRENEELRDKLAVCRHVAVSRVANPGRDQARRKLEVIAGVAASGLANTAPTPEPDDEQS